MFHEKSRDVGIAEVALSVRIVLAESLDRCSVGIDGELAEYDIKAPHKASIPLDALHE